MRNDTTDYPAPETCFACGDRATGYWVGVEPVAVCPTCAVETLPALIADAIHCHNTGQATESLRTVERRFWRALALRLARGSK